jgi:hypothetical protein
VWSWRTQPEHNRSLSYATDIDATDLFVDMQIYLFWSDHDREVFGFTFDPEGTNLPFEFAPWSKNDNGAALYAGPSDGVAFNAVISAVRRDGFYLARSAAPKDAPPFWNA